MPAGKISKEIIALISKTLEEGNYREVACRIAGIDRKTLGNWMKRGEHEKGGLYLELYEAVSLAEGTFEISALRLIQKAALTSWYAAAWLLERRWPERWGRREVPHEDEAEMDTLVVIG